MKKYFLRLSIGALIFAFPGLRLMAQDAFDTQVRSGEFSRSHGESHYAQMTVKALSGQLGSTRVKGSSVEALCLEQHYGSISTPLVLFGDKSSKGLMAVGKVYRFAVRAGVSIFDGESQWVEEKEGQNAFSLRPINEPQIRIHAYKTSEKRSKPSALEIKLPKFGTPEWDVFLENGASETFEDAGLITTVRVIPDEEQPWIELSHVAKNANYTYLVEFISGVPSSEDASRFLPLAHKRERRGAEKILKAAYAPVYTLHFDAIPAWQFTSVEPGFEDESYVQGRTPVSYVDPRLVSELDHEAALKLNYSPELRDDSELRRIADRFKGDPLAAASFVLNEMELTDMLTYEDISPRAYAETGTSALARSALGVLLEKQGSPLELCALTVFLLRAGGVPAWYAFPKEEGIGILKGRFNRLLGLRQVDSSAEDASSIVRVSYPWVVALVDGKWVNIFPWMKAPVPSGAVQNADFISAQSVRGSLWAKDYLLSSGGVKDYSIASAYSQRLKDERHGGNVNRGSMPSSKGHRYYYSWDRLPQPDVLPEDYEILDLLTQRGNCLDSIQLEVVLPSSKGGVQTVLVDTGDIPVAAFSNRRLTASWEGGSGEDTCALTLDHLEGGSQRVNVGVPYQSLSDAVQQQSLRWSASVASDIGSVELLVHYKRPSLEDSRNVCEWVESRVLDRGEFAALCLNLGRVTAAMVQRQRNAFERLFHDIYSRKAIDDHALFAIPSSLMGAEYFEQMTAFGDTFLPIYSGNRVALRSIALAKFKEEKTDKGVLVTPLLDVFHMKMGVLNVCSAPAHTGSIWDGRQDYFALYSLEASLREAWAVGHLFDFEAPVSAVSLIKHANDVEEGGVIRLTRDNFVKEGERVVGGKPLKSHNASLWDRLSSYFDQEAVDSEFVEAYVTPGVLAWSDFSGMAAFVITPYGSEALLDEMHGGYGGSMDIESVVEAFRGDRAEAKSAEPAVSNNYDLDEDPFLRRVTSLESYVHEWALPDAQAILGVPDTGGIIPRTFNHVNLITGAFRWEEEDLVLQGMFPFVMKRTYSSDRRGSGTLGYGWNVWFLEPVFIREKEAILTLPGRGSTSFKRVSDGVYHEVSGDIEDRLVFADSRKEWVLHRPTGDRMVYRYAGGGAVRMVAFENAMGDRYTFSYSETAVPYLASVLGSDGQTVSLFYDDARRLSRLATGDGRHVEYIYDKSGDLIAVENASGERVQYVYGERLENYDGTMNSVSTHLLERMTDPEGVFIKNTYDWWGRVVKQSSSVSEAAGAEEQYRYVYEGDVGSASGTTAVFALGKLKSRFHFSSGYMLKEEDALGYTVEQKWEPVSLPRENSRISLKWCKDKRGLERSYAYDPSGKCTKLTLKGALTGDVGTQEAVYCYEYDSAGRVVAAVDPLGDVTRTYYGSGILHSLPVKIEKYSKTECIHRTEFTYEVLEEGLGRPRVFLKEESIMGGVSPDKITRWSYHCKGNIASVEQVTGTEDANGVTRFAYTPRGEVARVESPSGAFIEFEYDMIGHLIEKTCFDASGVQLSYEGWSYDRAGRLIAHRGPQSNPVASKHYFYGSNGLLERIVQSRVEAEEGGLSVGDVGSTEFSYDALGRRISTIRPSGAVERFVYDEAGLLVSSSIVSSAGDLLTQEFFKYNAGGDLVEYTTDLGGKAHWTRSQEGREIEHTDVSGYTVYSRYDLVGRPVEHGVDGGRVTSHFYYYKENQLRIIERSQVDEVALERIRLFDCRGNLVSWTDFSGNAFSAEYDGLDRMCAWVGPVEHDPLTERRSFDFSYNLEEGTVSKRGGGFFSVRHYDLLGRMVRSEDFDQEGVLSSSKQWIYEFGGRKVTTIKGDEDGALSCSQWLNHSGQVFLRNWGDGRSEIFAYDHSGNLVFEKNALGQERHFEYDALGRLTYKASSDAPEVSIRYDRKGHLVYTELGNSIVHAAVRDLNGQIVFESLSSGDESISQSVYHYFESGPHAGLLRHAKHQDGTQVEYFYDAWRRPITVKGFSAKRQETVDYGYSACGYLHSVTTSNGERESTRVERDYDAYGQVIAERVIVDDALLDSWVQSWDARGYRTQLASGDLVLDYTYNPSGQLVEIEDPWGNAYSYRYDASGRLIGSSNPWRALQLDYAAQSLRPSSRVLTAIGSREAIFSEKLDYERGRVSATSFACAGAGVGAAQFAYDGASGHLLGEYFSNGDTRHNIDYAYDPSLGACVHRSQPGGWDFQGTLDLWGRIQSLDYEVGRRRFTAWGAAPGAESVEVSLGGVGAQSVRFDPSGSESIWFTELDLPMGEHIMRVDARDAQGEVSSTESTFTVQGQSNKVVLDYDGRGNVIKKQFADGTNHSLEWDAWGRLVEVRGQGPQGDFSWNATYDGLGRQLRAVYRPGDGGEAVTVDASYDPEVEFLEIKTTHQGNAHWFIYGPDLTQQFGGLQGQGGLEAVISAEGKAEGMLLDAWGNTLGSVREDGVHWHSVLLSGYGPEPTQIPSIFPWETDWSKVFAWRGLRLEMSGYYRMGVRPYDASLASFLAPDPHGAPASANLYAYAGGDPRNAYDPEGRSAYLLDGTWAHEDGMQDNPALTNAQRLHLNYIGPGESHYFRGVGNSKDNSWFAQYWGGATGAGAREIVEDAYDEIVSNYNSGDTHVLIAGWSRGAAECMELAWTLYLRGIPNLKRGGYLVPPEQACPVIDQIHLMDTVHSMGVPGNDINRGWHDLDLPPNIYRSYHYLAGDPPSFGFRQTRPPSANEKAYCGGHGDIGGSVDTDCRRWVYRSIVERSNGHGLTLFDEDSIEEYVDGDPSQ